MMHRATCYSLYILYQTYDHDQKAQRTLDTLQEPSKVPHASWVAVLSLYMIRVADRQV